MPPNRACPICENEHGPDKNRSRCTRCATSEQDLYRLRMGVATEVDLVQRAWTTVRQEKGRRGDDPLLPITSLMSRKKYYWTCKGCQNEIPGVFQCEACMLKADGTKVPQPPVFVRECTGCDRVLGENERWCTKCYDKRDNERFRIRRVDVQPKIPSSVTTPTPEPEQKMPDWTCQGCHENVHGYKDHCYKCGTSKDAVRVSGLKSSRTTMRRDGDWDCPKCVQMIHGRKDHCFKCGTTKVQAAAAAKGKSMEQLWDEVTVPPEFAPRPQAIYDPNTDRDEFLTPQQVKEMMKKKKMNETQKDPFDAFLNSKKPPRAAGVARDPFDAFFNTPVATKTAQRKRSPPPVEEMDTVEEVPPTPMARHTRTMDVLPSVQQIEASLKRSKSSVSPEAEAVDRLLASGVIDAEMAESLKAQIKPPAPRPNEMILFGDRMNRSYTVYPSAGLKVRNDRGPHVETDMEDLTGRAFVVDMSSPKVVPERRGCAAVTYDVVGVTNKGKPAHITAFFGPAEEAIAYAGRTKTEED